MDISAAGPIIHTSPSDDGTSHGEVPADEAFSSVHAAFHNPLNQDRHLISRETDKAQRSAAMAELGLASPARTPASGDD